MRERCFDASVLELFFLKFQTKAPFVMCRWFIWIVSFSWLLGVGGRSCRFVLLGGEIRLSTCLSSINGCANGLIIAAKSLSKLYNVLLEFQQFRMFDRQTKEGGKVFILTQRFREESRRNLLTLQMPWNFKANVNRSILIWVSFRNELSNEIVLIALLLFCERFRRCYSSQGED